MFSRTEPMTSFNGGNVPEDRPGESSVLKISSHLIHGVSDSIFYKGRAKRVLSFILLGTYSLQCFIQQPEHCMQSVDGTIRMNKHSRLCVLWRIQKKHGHLYRAVSGSERFTTDLKYGTHKYSHRKNKNQ